MILVKVICICELHVFFHQYVADIRERKLENIFRTVSTSSLVFNMRVMRRSGAIRISSDVPVGQLQPLTTMVSCTDAGSMVTPFVVPPPPDIVQPCKQLQDFLTCRTPESRQPSLLCSLSASSSALTLPRNLAEFSSSLFSIDRFQPLRGKSSHPTSEALLPLLADHGLFPDLDDTNIAVHCGTFPGSGYPSSLPACATVRTVLSAGPSGAPDWVGCQDLYDTAREITYLCISHILVRPFRSDDSPIRRIRRDESGSPRYAQILGVRRSAVFLWKPGIGMAASSFSALRQRGMSGVVPSPVSLCRLCLDWITVPYILLLGCVIQILHLRNQLDGYPYDRIIEFVGGWCLALTFHAGGQNFGSGSSDSNPLAFEYWTCVISGCNVHNCVRHSTLVDRTL